MKRYVFFLFLLASCAAADNARPHLSLNSLQPEVLDLMSGDTVVVLLSQEIDPKTVNATSFFVERLLGENRVWVEGDYQFQQGNTEIIFTPNESWKEGDYKVTLTHEVMTADFLPLKGSEAENYLRYVGYFSVQPTLSEASSLQISPESDTQETQSVPELARPEQLVMNELLYDVVGSDTDGQVFIELFGTPHTFVDDYSICWVNGDGGDEYARLDLPANTEIPDDGLLVLADQTNANPLASNVANADLLFNFDPQNGPDCVQLLDHNGELIDALGYGPLSSPCYEANPAVDVPSGFSLSRVDAFDSDNNSNDFLSLETPSPGEL